MFCFVFVLPFLQPRNRTEAEIHSITIILKRFVIVFSLAIGCGFFVLFFLLSFCCPGKLAPRKDSSHGKVYLNRLIDNALAVGCCVVLRV